MTARSPPTSYGRLLGGNGVFPEEFLHDVYHIDLFLKQIKRLETSAIAVIEGENRRKKWLNLSEGLTTYSKGLILAGSCRAGRPYMRMTKMAEAVMKVSEKWENLENDLKGAVIEPLRALRDKEHIRGFYQWMEFLEHTRVKVEESQEGMTADEIAHKVKMECYAKKFMYDKYIYECLKELEGFKNIAPKWLPFEKYFNMCAADILQPFFRLPWEMEQGGTEWSKKKKEVKEEVKEEDREVPYSPLDDVRKKSIAGMGIVANVPPEKKRERKWRKKFFKSSKKDSHKEDEEEKEETSEEPKSFRSFFRKKKKAPSPPVELPSDWHSFTSPKSGEDNDSD